MVRTDRYKMIIYPTANRVRLYDLENDALEMNDLAADKEKYASLMMSLLEKLVQQQQAMDDPVDVTQAFENFMNDAPPPALPRSN
jgi:choline-sulfatase